MTEPFATSPLAHRTPLAADPVRLAEVSFLGLITLRGVPDAVEGGAAKVLGTALPSGAGATAWANELAVLRLGPDEWIIVTPPDTERALIEKLRQALAGTHYQLVDVSDYYTAIDIAGEKAWKLLSALVTVDLHPRAFTPGMAVATLAAKANVWLWRREDGDGPAFRLFTRRSHADYLWCLLAEAGREWGLPPEDPIGRVRVHLPHFEE